MKWWHEYQGHTITSGHYDSVGTFYRCSCGRVWIPIIRED